MTIKDINSENTIAICFRGVRELCSGDLITNLTITAQVFQEDKLTAIGPVYSIAGDGNGNYSGVIPKDIITPDLDRVFVRIFMDGGGPTLQATIWKPYFVYDRTE